MSEIKSDVYRKLQKHLDTFAVGFPATKSRVELRILKYLFTPEEASIATHLNFSFEDIESIYERIKDSGISLKKLKNYLKIMAKKGCIHSKMDGEKRTYANAVLVIGMYEYQVKNLSKEFVKDFFKYSIEAFNKELFKSKITQLRTIPVEKSITHDLDVANYENIREIVKKFDGPIAVVKCICREAKEVLGKSCKQTSLRETCFPFGWHAQFFIDNGWGRSVSKEEALEIFNKAEEDGLIVQVSNTIQPHVICCCCNCCCGSISTLKRHPKPVSFFSSNYHANIDPELCIGCGICVDRCKMTAIELINEKSQINLNRCIGCGNCVVICPENAIQLKKKENRDVPVETMDDLYIKIGKKIQKLEEKHKY
ncbi:MAG: 4Fe-4S binding protein [Promethearchaeota archaeon]